MSFIDQEDILAVAEKIVARVWKETVNYDHSTSVAAHDICRCDDYTMDRTNLIFVLQIS